MKKIALYGAIGYGLWYITRKSKDIFNAYNALTTQVVNVRNVKPGLSEFTLDVDVLISNPTQTAISVNTGGLAKLKRVNFYSVKGTLIGHSSPGTTSLNIPAGGKQLIKNVPTSINTGYVLEALGNIKNIGDVNTTIEIEVAGQTIIV